MAAYSSCLLDVAAVEARLGIAAAVGNGATAQLLLLLICKERVVVASKLLAVGRRRRGVAAADGISGPRMSSPFELLVETCDRRARSFSCRYVPMAAFGSEKIPEEQLVLARASVLPCVGMQKPPLPV